MTKRFFKSKKLDLRSYQMFHKKQKKLKLKPKNLFEIKN